MEFCYNTRFHLILMSANALMLSIRQRCRWRYLLGFGSMTMQEPAYGSCTPAGIMRMLEHYESQLKVNMQW